MVNNFLLILNKIGLLVYLKVIYAIYCDLICYLKCLTINVRFRSLNKHNKTFVANSIKDSYFPIKKVTVGNHSYGPVCVYYYGNAEEKLLIGNYCSISSGVKFILGGNHSTNTISTFPFKYFFNKGEHEALTKGPIIVEDDVWIGTDSMILSGVTIGKGAVVAAGTIVTKSIAPYSVVGGAPAKLIKMRFDENIIAELMTIDFNKLNPNNIKIIMAELIAPLDKKVINQIKVNYEKF